MFTTLLGNASQFLIQTLFDLYTFVVLLRIVFHWAKVEGRNPLLQVIARLTYLPLRPIYRIVPSVNGIDLAAVLLLLALTTLKIGLLHCLITGVLPQLTGLLVLAFSNLLNQLINIFFYTLLALALMSWFNPVTFPPLIEILIKISEPLLRPIHRILPPIAGIDFSSLVMIVSLQLLKIVIVIPLAQTGQKLLFYGG
jgi:YggT family protein